MTIQRTSYYYDLNLLRSDLDRYKSYFNEINQLSIKYDPRAIINDEEPHYSCIGASNEKIKTWSYSTTTPIFQGSEFDKLLSMINRDTRRVRLMAMKPRSCYSLHQDTYKRIHWALETWSECHITFKRNNDFVGYHIPADGYGYLLDTTIFHTAVNPTLFTRYHLVLDVVD